MLTQSGSFLDMPKKDTAAYSMLMAIRKMRDGILGTSRSFDGVEAEAHQEIFKRLGPPAGTMNPHATFYVPYDVQIRDITVAANPQLVGTTTTGSFIDHLRNKQVLLRLGAQRLSGMRDNIALPRQTSAASPNHTWFTNEGTTATECNLVFNQVLGSPHTVGCYFELSNKIVKQSDPASEAVVSNTLANDLAVAGDAAGLNGSGASGEPLGIIGTSGVGTFAAGASMNFTQVVEAQTDICDANGVVNPGSLAYVTTPTVASLIKGRQRFTGTDSPLWRGAVHQGELEGVQALSTRNMPTGKMIYGDFSQAAVAEWGVLAIEVNPFANFQAGIIGVRGLWSMDILVNIMDEKELRKINQPKPLGPDQDPNRLIRCRVVGGVDAVYGWTAGGRTVQLGDLITLPAVDAVAFEKIGRVKIV
jgi:HK97 family phage major capsid protein